MIPAPKLVPELTATRLIARSYVDVHTTPVPRLHPRIVLEKCWSCFGLGRHLVRHRGRIVESTCANCAGRGSIAVDA